MDADGPSPDYSPPYWVRFLFGRNPSVTLLRIVILAIATIIVFKFILLPIRVTGDSMFPTFKDRQIRFVNRLAYRHHDPQRGDVVAVEFRGRQVLLLKRIVGLPGERLEVIDGELYINGEKLHEPYAYGKITARSGKGLGSTREPINLERTEYMVMGDNRLVSEGYIKERSQIVGKIL